MLVEGMSDYLHLHALNLHRHSRGRQDKGCQPTSWFMLHRLREACGLSIGVGFRQDGWIRVLLEYRHRKSC